MTNFAVVERRHLAALLRRVGEDAPTLCEGWDTRDLAVHLVERDSRPDIMISKHVPSVPFLSKKAQASSEALHRLPWAELVSAIEKPSLLSPAHIGPLDRRLNTVEFFIHHEDVRRAQQTWHRRHLLQDEEKDLWATLRIMAKPQLRHEQDSVILIAPGYGSARAGKGKTHRVQVLRGAPSELLLWAFGRKEAAEVEITEE